MGGPKIELDPRLRLLGGGAPISRAALRAFEAEHKTKVPESYAEFLVTTANGGYPDAYWEFPVYRLDGVELSWCKLHGLYGIYTEVPSYDLTEFWDVLTQITSGLAFPFAFDDGDDHVCIRTSSTSDGEVCYIPWGERLSEIPEENSSYHVADSLDEFWDKLRFEPSSD